MTEEEMAEYLSEKDIPLTVGEYKKVELDFSGASDLNDGYANER